MPGPLAGLHVLELATGVAGPYAGRLLAMLGATVVKIEPPGGDPARRLPVDHRPLEGLSPVFVHLAAGKRLVDARRVPVEAAVGWAHVVLDGRVRSDVTGTPVDPDSLQEAGRDLVLATTTAWGFDEGEPGDVADELLVQAASGLCSASQDDDGRPLRFPGWQAQYLSGAYLAAAALAALGEPGFHHVEVRWIDAVLTGVEAGVCAFLYEASRPVPAEEGRSRQGGLQVGAFPSGAFACADGHVVPGTVRPEDWQLQCQVYGRPELVEDERWSWRNRWENREALRAELEPWYGSHTKREIFEAALDAGWAAAMVMTAGDALDDPHLAERGFLGPVTGDPGGEGARVPCRPWRAPDLAEAEPVRLAAPGEDTGWFSDLLVEGAGHSPDGPPRPPELRGVRVLELTWAWAGPFVGRFLGAFGADVVRLETGRFPDGWRTRLRWRDVGVDVPPGVDPDEHTWDAAALFNSLARNKRGASVDLATDGGRDAFLRLLDAADVLVVNMTHSVLADRGVEEQVLAAVDRGLVLLTMPALGATGPYRSLPGYGMLMEGMGGFAARYGHPDEGARTTSTYYPDAVAGVHGTLAVLSELARRQAAGPGAAGAVVDLSQQETTWLQLAEALVLRSRDGREPDRIGDAEPGMAASGFRRAGVAWAAVVAEAGGGGEEPTGRVSPVRTWRDLWDHGGFEARDVVEWLDHPVARRRAYLRVPVRVDGRSLDTRRAAPVFAQHTDEVLAEWAGLDAGAIEQLRAQGEVGTVPTAKRR